MKKPVVAAWGAFLRPAFDEVLAEANIEVVPVGRDQTPLQVAPDCDALYVRLPSYASAEIIAGLPRLKALAVPGAGVEVIDLAAATLHRVPVLSGIGMGAEAVAEWTVGSMLWLTRYIGQMHEAMRTGEWLKRFNLEPRRDLRNLTIGIIGYGQIGERVATAVADGFGSRVLVNDILPHRQGVAMERGFQVRDIDDVMRESDIVSIHAQAIHGEGPLIDRRRIELLQPTSCIINTSRGALLDYEALIDALEHGAIRGAAMDVFPQEPPPQSFIDRLTRHPHVLVSPHQAGMTLDATDALAVGVASSIVDVLNGKRPANCVNPEVWKH
jgi:D-3-phosphoglycerate dehydrogenase